MTDSGINRRSVWRQTSQLFVGDIRWRVFIFALVGCELLILSLAYTNNFTFVCRDAAPAFVCEFLSRSVMRAIAFIGTFLIFAFSKPDVFRLLFDAGDRTDQRRSWLWVQLAGFGLVMLPWFFVSDSASTVVTFVGFVSWGLGFALAGVGTCFALTSPDTWQKLLTRLGPVSLTVLAVTVFAPEITDWARSIWSIEPLTRLTFDMVVATLDAFGIAATTHPEEVKLSYQDFSILIGSQCSGVEGFALISLFLLCYFYAFSDDLKFPHVWILLPISLFLSWGLNVIRIAVLFTIGVRVSPELAVEGFHSHAGWLMFTLLAFSMIGVSRLVPAFYRSDPARVKRLPLQRDWMAARILPFAAFMAASLLLSTFTQVPELWYVAKVLMMTVALALFVQLYAGLNWKLDLPSIFLGIIIGLLWIGTGLSANADVTPLDVALESLPRGLFISWVLLRLVGTVVLVPMVEELFFRGYVLNRLDRGGTAMYILALLVSSGLFALLHDRWVLAGIAGLIYGLIYLRRRNLVDAISAHAASNSVIAAYALATSDWAMI